ncbi:MAG: YraN family protein [Candidatus Omnitrophica bacterium]|nr:YraN family protein [Candidatus Omnitrophota bacterium]
MTNQSLGLVGEEAAVAFLKEKGYRILERNFKCRLGEVDIVARDNETYCFVEVKTRSSEDFGLPQEAVSRQKQAQISKAALHYLKTKKLFEKSARFDVVSVLYKDDVPKIDLIENAFELDAHFSY